VTVLAPDHLEAIRRESEAFALAAGLGDLTARVPSCPEWTLADLVHHLTDVQWFWTRIVAGPLLDGDDVGDRPERVPDDRLVARFREGADDLAGSIERSDPTTRVYSWADGEQDVAWVARRQAHEAAIHRWDAESAAGTPQPVDPALALDGVDEWIRWMVDPSELEPVGPLSLRLLATDLDAERILDVQADGTFAAERGGRPDGSIEATASELDLLLWRRLTSSDVSVLGDRTTVERFLAAVDLD
jgi:uncharacterized protein (TIGR03083 family)